MNWRKMRVEDGVSMRLGDENLKRGRKHGLSGAALQVGSIPPNLSRITGRVGSDPNSKQVSRVAPLYIGVCLKQNPSDAKEEWREPWMQMTVTMQSNKSIFMISEYLENLI
ncbi:hypothetical protein CIPAW_08G062400 [Carya illinoinensis]|uniref:Uncharacterized protein n=1 Tax=Carya illinoinensis TaxID=32201 RepID=A0A8T1PRW5_CARIL|nr:hypothetical protein CIPAW_08G062400 [Carya illinoinensis]